MTDQERATLRKQWNKIIARWKWEKIDRKSYRFGTLDDEAPRPSPYTTSEDRLEALMKLRWLNYGPQALYGRIEKVYSFATLSDEQ
jgi:hypothetical protein